MGAWDARSEAPWAAWRAARAAGLCCCRNGGSTVSKLVLNRNAVSRASKLVLAQHFVLGVFADLKRHFGSPTKEAFVLRTDAAFAAMGAWDARSAAAWMAWSAARAAGG